MDFLWKGLLTQTYLETTAHPQRNNLEKFSKIYLDWASLLAESNTLEVRNI